MRHLAEELNVRNIIVNDTVVYSTQKLKGNKMNFDKEDFQKAIDAVTSPDDSGGVIVNIAALAEAFVYMAKAGGKTKVEALELFNNIWAEMQITVKEPGEPPRIG